MKKTILIIYLLIVICNCAFAQNDGKIKLNADKKNSTISYSMHHPLHSWDADSKEVNSIILMDNTKTTLYQAAVSVRISSFDSKNANRDSHTIEVTDAIKYPNVTFSSTSINDKGNGELVVKGNLTFHGVTKSITVNCTKKKSNDLIEIKGKFVVDMTDYKIEPPSLMGIATDKNIEMSFNLKFK